MVVIGTVASTTASAAPGAAPAGVDTVVYPTGTWPTDVRNVQAAVDLGGTVLLKSTTPDGTPGAFNFGTPQFFQPERIVRLRADVAVLGEQTGAARTTIEGGSIPFLGQQPTHTRIQGIVFRGFLNSAITITRSTGAEIVGNHISGAVGALLSFGLTEGRGIKFLGNSDPQNAITGRVVVAENVIDDMHADLSDAIVFDAVAADVEIVGNRVGTVQSAGVLVIDGNGSVLIADNVVAPGAGDPGEFSFGNGIFVVGLDPSQRARHRIVRNQVVAENRDADGIALVGFDAAVQDPIVEQNRVTMTSSRFGAISFGDLVSGASVAHNVIEGQAATALGVFELGLAADPVASHNSFVGNNLTRFTATTADVFLDRHTVGNVVTGYVGSLVDLGEGNRVTGFGRVDGEEPLGRQIREGRRDRQAALSWATNSGMRSG